MKIRNLRLGKADCLSDLTVTPRSLRADGLQLQSPFVYAVINEIKRVEVVRFNE